jgi:acetyl/propionyl-CoA carboxylase alpha subunit
MFFEADLRGKHYKIDVVEARSAWLINLQPDGGDWIRYEISKTDYRLVENVISLIFNGGSYVLDVIGSGTEYDVYARGAYRKVKIYNDESILHASLKRGGTLGSSDILAAGMPGKISKVLVAKGEEVTANQPLIIMEAMKMENEMRASQAARVKDILVKQGDSVDSGAVLIKFEPAKAAMP